MPRFDGVSISDLGFICGAQNVQFINQATSVLDIPGRRGVAFVSTKPAALTVSFSVTHTGQTPTERRLAFGALYALLDTSEPKMLELPDMGGRSYRAILSDASDLTYCLNGLSGDLRFLILDPIAYGQAQSATVSSGGGAAISINGDAPSALHVLASAARRDSTDGCWTIRDDTSGSYISVPINTTAARRIEIDSESQTVTIGGVAAVPTLESDWLVLCPGEHHLSIAGTGDASVTWYERWH